MNKSSVNLRYKTLKKRLVLYFMFLPKIIIYYKNFTIFYKTLQKQEIPQTIQNNTFSLKYNISQNKIQK